MVGSEVLLSSRRMLGLKHKRRNKTPTFSASRNVDEEGGMKKNCWELEVEKTITSQQRDSRLRPNPRKRQEIRAETFEDGHSSEESLLELRITGVSHSIRSVAVGEPHVTFSQGGVRTLHV